MHPSSRTRPRGLRIGVVLGDTLIAEQTLEAGTFSIGRKASCSVPLPFPGLPARWELLSIDGRGVRLRVMPAMDVRLADGAAVRSRGDLEGDAGPGKPLDVAIPTGARGKVTLGEIKVMFQEVELAPRAPKPALPPELRSTLADRIDRRVVAFAAASLALHVGVMAAARLNDPAIDLTQAEQAMAELESETYTIDADELPIVPPPAPAKDPAPAANTSKEPSPPVDPPSKRPSVDRPARPSTPTAPVDPATTASRTADELFGGDGGGLLPGDAARRRPSGDLAQQLAELRDQQARAELGDGSGRDLPSRPGPELGTSQEPGGEVPSQTVPTSIPKHPEPDHVRVTLTPPKRPPGEPPLDAIIGKIKSAYMPGLVRCYKRAMVDTGPMSGKVVLTFEVNERGTVASGASATGVDDGLEQCVEGLMASWRFTPVLDEDGDATEVDVKLTLQLRPD